jgi:hypothetical protein
MEVSLWMSHLFQQPLRSWQSALPALGSEGSTGTGGGAEINLHIADL